MNALELEILRTADPSVIEAVRSGELSLKHGLRIAKEVDPDCQAMAVQSAVNPPEPPTSTVDRFDELVRGLSRTETKRLREHVCAIWGLVPDKQSTAAIRRDMSQHGGRRKPKDDDFAAFWAAYPKKVGKAAAQKAYLKAFTCLRRRMSADEVVQLLTEKVRIYARVRDPQYYCNPATWLNDGRWDDDVSAMNGRNGSNESLGARETFNGTEQFNQWLQPQKK